MALTKPLDLYELLVVKLAGQDQFLTIFTFLSLIVVSVMAARFKMTAMSLFVAIAIFSFIMYQGTNAAGSFGVLLALSVVGFALVLISAIRSKLD